MANPSQCLIVRGFKSDCPRARRVGNDLNAFAARVSRRLRQ
jgi:hypothetical protein